MSGFCSAHKGFKPGCPQCEIVVPEDRPDKANEPRPIQPEEEAVLRAADVWRLTFGTNAEEHTVSIVVLEEAVDALAALRKAPKPVKPEEVEPGTRFRFADVAATTDCQCLMLRGEKPMWWNGRADCGPLGFMPGDRIIPIEESDQ